MLFGPAAILWTEYQLLLGLRLTKLQVTYKLQYSLSKTTKQKGIVRVLFTFHENQVRTVISKNINTILNSNQWGERKVGERSNGET